MSSAVIVAPGKIEVRRAAVPVPGPNQLRVRMQGCGICASNLPVWQGREWFSYPQEPGAPGHEGWGVVDAVGREVTEFAVGQRVACMSYKAYAEYDLVDSGSAVVLPDSLEGVAFPGEPLACAVNVFSRSDIRKDHRVAIVGIGFLGGLLTSLAAAAGAEVIAISRRPCSLRLARQMGAVHVIAMDDHYRIIEEVDRTTDGARCERVIEAVGLQWPLDLAGELTATRGRLIVAGYHQDGPRQVNMQMWNWRGLDVVNAHERDLSVYTAGMRRAIDAVERKRLTPFDMLTHRFTLDQLDDAFEMLQSRPEGFVKGYLTF
ncbi:MAG: zinc-binding dehydrogenase [Phycisphaerae bacterium]|nr:zinc-binding dehydrogenase [Phycisphaerae bacterium]